MPSLDWNMHLWNHHYDWEYGKGEEWSEAWGSSEAQWFTTLYPRIRGFLPAANILEIAPGFGRWTKFLLGEATEAYRAVDIGLDCVQFCRNQFESKHPGFKAVLNDGWSLKEVSDLRYDLLFSFDSLVHSSPDVLDGYIGQGVQLMNPGGVFFLHHSNLEAVKDNIEGCARHNRDENVCAKKVASLVEENGGMVLLQEVISWGRTPLLDAITIFSRSDGPYRPAKQAVVQNPDFMEESKIAKRIYDRYAGLAVRANQGNR